jgi:hypothetical protein
MAACFAWVHDLWACFFPGKMVGGAAEEVHEVGEFLLSLHLKSCAIPNQSSTSIPMASLA